MPTIRDDIFIVTWEVCQGDTWARTFTIEDDDTPASPIDLTGSTFTAAVYASRGSTSGAEKTFTVAIVSAVAGQLSLTMSAANSALVAGGEHWFECEWTDTDGKKRTPFGGPLIVGVDTV